MFHEMTHTIVSLGWAAAILGIAWMRHQHKMAQIHAGQHDPQSDATASEHAREIARLRERLRVLERIATDAERHTSSQSLAAQIDALKD